MKILHRSTVQSDEIDSLGHMNVRYYVARMERANARLIDALDVDRTVIENGLLSRVDTYTRFQREQFEGAQIVAEGGTLRVGEGGLESFVQIRNETTDEVAATFIVRTALLDRDSRRPLPFPRVAGAQANIDVPERAQPRTLTLGPIESQVTMETLTASIPEVEGGGMMSGRREALVEPGDVDAEGWLKRETELMFLPFAKMAAETGIQQGPPVFETKDGRRVGWAVMETRTQSFGQARLGDELAYFSADVALAEKTRISRRWAFAKRTGQMLGMSDTVGLCIDLDARRAVPWPEDLRATIEANLQPQLA